MRDLRGKQRPVCILLTETDQDEASTRFEAFLAQWEKCRERQNFVMDFPDDPEIEEFRMRCNRSLERLNALRNALGEWCDVHPCELSELALPELKRRGEEE